MSEYETGSLYVSVCEDYSLLWWDAACAGYRINDLG
jgi:hypothetical protein